MICEQLTSISMVEISKNWCFKQFYQFYLCQSKSFKFMHPYKKQHSENCSADCIQDKSWRQKLETKAGQKPCLSRSASENYGCWQINVISVCNLDRKFKAHIGKKILMKNLWQAHLQFVATHLLYRGTESH